MLPEHFYPPSPEINDPKFLKPSVGYKRSAALVIVSIFLFFIFYIVLVALSSILFLLSLFLAFFLVKQSIIFLPIALGLGFFGIMFFIFIIKFIFARYKYKNEYCLEIKSEDQPLLFEFIQKISDEINSSFPRRIFVIPDSNARVYYNSSFWSMFFPINKNLEIGLTLINSMNISELKVIIAHELGHFSQKSMKLGSYIYTVNRAIFNLVYDYTFWDKIIYFIIGHKGYFSMFGSFALLLAEKVRGLLRLAYGLINKTYMRLSREMEFHADLVSISLAGSEACISALRRSDFAGYAYEKTMQVLTNLAWEGKSSENIFLNHRFAVSHLGYLHSLQMDDGMPIITDEEIEKNILKSRIYIKDQWASHPSPEARKKNIFRKPVTAKSIQLPARNLLINSDKLEAELTVKMYKLGFPDKEFKPMGELEFEDFILGEEKKYFLSKNYNKFYYDRYIQEINIEEVINQSPKGDELNFEMVYSVQNVEIIKKLISDEDDLQILNDILNNKIQIKYFEFDAVKYSKNDAEKLRDGLQNEISELEKKVIEIDKQSFLLNYRQAEKTGKEKIYFELYNQIIQLKNKSLVLKKFYSDCQEISFDLYSKKRWYDDYISAITKRLSALENSLREFCYDNKLMSVVADHSSSKQMLMFQEYLGAIKYFNELPDFTEEKFHKFFDIIFNIGSALRYTYAAKLKDLSEFQLELNGLKSE